ncbi:major facilitator superfamily domain-containing protein [Polychytrium aggregatum]|uniref:major facilitator superfamily domain-containing protein n=1 Tax=Polychytrium aggregatum TaxID=110093 RepID=UPI0022FEB5C6|nr:major facilitator superfamily domain-containing protein [Polychytrium aggregatum]XP_052970470.1 major facilitator superfamily domain-containing protein [Polychytrium aggregatum]KAI9199773.1 major facilitator superfamily domain-containing protein [Polychytrium aggregatum]KAI9208390.1 major facilitator superfamily domain-containing protein [Polychytrium aggregatum]
MKVPLGVVKWSQVLILFLLNVSCNLIWLAYAPVADASAAYFNGSLSVVNWLNNVYVLMFLPGSVVSALVLDRSGVRRAIQLGSILQCVGVAFCFGAAFVQNSTARIGLTVVGQAITGFAQPFFLDACPKQAYDWFPVDQRAVPTACSTIGSPVGSAVAFLIVPAVVQSQGDIQTLLLYYTCLLAGLMIITLVVAREPPPQAESALKEEVRIETSLRKSYSKCLGTKLFWLLSVTAAGGISLFSDFTSYLNQIMSPYGYTSDDTGTMGAVLVFSGVIATFVFGYLADRTRRHAVILKVNVLMVFVGYVFFSIIFNKPGNFVLAVVACAIIGIFSVGSLPVFLDIIVAVTRQHGIGEGVSMSLLWGSSQVLIVIMNVIWDRTRNPDQSYPAVPWIVLGTWAACLIPLQFYPLSQDMIHLDARLKELSGDHEGAKH